MAVDEDLVPLRFAAEDRVVVEDQRATARLKTAKVMGRRETGNAAAYDHEVVALASFHDVDRALVEGAFSYLMRDPQQFGRVAV